MNPANELRKVASQLRKIAQDGEFDRLIDEVREELQEEERQRGEALKIRPFRAGDRVRSTVGESETGVVVGDYPYGHLVEVQWDGQPKVKVVNPIYLDLVS
jgi:hypothetical protein